MKKGENRKLSHFLHGRKRRRADDLLTMSTNNKNTIDLKPVKEYSTAVENPEILRHLVYLILMKMLSKSLNLPL